jgi:hypothetical protein
MCHPFFAVCHVGSHPRELAEWCIKVTGQLPHLMDRGGLTPACRIRPIPRPLLSRLPGDGSPERTAGRQVQEEAGGSDPSAWGGNDGFERGCIVNGRRNRFHCEGRSSGFEGVSDNIRWDMSPLPG